MVQPALPPDHPSYAVLFKRRVWRTLAIVSPLLLGLSDLAMSDPRPLPQPALGIYSVPAAACSTVAAAGFTIVQNYAFESNHPADVSAFTDSAEVYLATAARYGLLVLLGLPRNWLAERREDLLRQSIRTLREHEGLLAWYEDERGQSGDVGAVLWLDHIVQEEDPAHGLIIEEMLNTPVLIDVGRIRMFTFYPVTAAARKKGRLMDIEQRFPVHTLTVPFWPVLQVFGRDLIEGYPKKDFMAPSWDELQYALYAATIAGCRGAFFYTYSLSSRYDMGKARQGRFAYADPRPLPEFAPHLWASATIGVAEARVLLDLLRDAVPAGGIELPRAEQDLAMGAWTVREGTLLLLANPRYRSESVVLRLDTSSGSFRRLHRGQFGPPQTYTDHTLEVVLPGPGGACLLLDERDRSIESMER